MTEYLEAPTIPISGDVYAFWRNVGDEWEILQILARKFLSAPLSSVESERLFSTAGQILSELRNRLSDENVEKLLYLHHNLLLLNFDY